MREGKTKFLMGDGWRLVFGEHSDQEKEDGRTGISSRTRDGIPGM